MIIVGTIWDQEVYMTQCYNKGETTLTIECYSNA